MDYTIPVWHPAVVHFPIALLVFGAASAAAYAAVGRPFWRRVALLAFVPGTALAGVAIETGEALYDEVEGTPIVEELVGRHETLAEWTFWIGVLVTLALAAAEVWRRRARA
ncbi:MAG: DUF2231 domain-containing protein, partial [Rhodothermales bacterium]|nr:DUF2231 domain-containing protein [Rhodothermales bacterium]